MAAAVWPFPFHWHDGRRERPAGPFDPHGRKFPGWAGVIGPWGNVLGFVDQAGNDEAMIVRQLDPVSLIDRREHPNFLARELRPELYQFQ